MDRFVCMSVEAAVVVRHVSHNVKHIQRDIFVPPDPDSKRRGKPESESIERKVCVSFFTFSLL